MYMRRLIVLSGLDTVREEDEGKGRPRRNPNAIIYDASRFPRHVFRGFARTFDQRATSPPRRAHGSNTEGRKSKRRKDAQTPKGGEKERGKMPVDKRRRCNEPKEARVLKCLFEFLAKWPSVRSAGHSSQPESNEITRIYILWFTSLSSAFSAPSPLGVLVCRPSTTHYGLVFSFVSSSIPLLLPSPLPPRLVLLFVHRAVGEPTVKLRIPFLWESWQIIAIFEKFGTIFFQGDFIEKKALAPDLVYGLPVL